MSTFLTVYCVISIIEICVALITLLCVYLKSPFLFPYMKIRFDVTGVRKPDINDYIDNYLIDNKMVFIDEQMRIYDYWKRKCEKEISKSLFVKRRRYQYMMCDDKKGMFVFIFTRALTRYKQVNYVKYPYQVTTEVDAFKLDYDYILARYTMLKEINFACPLNTYHSNNQRKLMTKELRKMIMVRDNYTCQICGKYMPDEIGLQIDHIIPVSKGGKTIPSNLQVLCSKCNGKKSNKYYL